MVTLWESCRRVCGLPLSCSEILKFGSKLWRFFWSNSPLHKLQNRVGALVCDPARWASVGRVARAHAAVRRGSHPGICATPCRVVSWPHLTLCTTPASLSCPGFPSSTRRTLCTATAAMFCRISAVHASCVAQADALHYRGVGSKPRPPIEVRYPWSSLLSTPGAQPSSCCWPPLPWPLRAPRPVPLHRPLSSPPPPQEPPAPSPATSLPPLPTKPPEKKHWWPEIHGADKHRLRLLLRPN